LNSAADARTLRRGEALSFGCPFVWSYLNFIVLGTRVSGEWSDGDEDSAFAGCVVRNTARALRAVVED
jgi:hypothetical protein